uniref:Uncharacterized protein n=1 Tax=Rhizobium rhizogenes TaxID=359 RepID=A0A4P8DKC7_RHIRH|nr:hypothetical protein pTiC5.7_99 [Rhizobium rhizogenes]QCL10941.1 hypothetical protein pTiC6.5_99 [Rhizobium rhizogenes]
MLHFLWLTRSFRGFLPFCPFLRHIFIAKAEGPKQHEECPI